MHYLFCFLFLDGVFCKGENEEYLACGTACPATCENYKEVRPCTMQCVSGCFCTKGTVRNGNKCVGIEEC